MATQSSTTKPTPTTNQQHPIVGTALLALLRDTVRVAREEATAEAGSVAYEAANQVADTLSWVPPSTPEEALAAAVLIHDEASDIEQAHEWSEERCQEWSTRIRRRAVALAAWIETAHGIDREKLGLDFFCSSSAEQILLPHSPSHPAEREGAAPLRAGKNAAWDVA